MVGIVILLSSSAVAFMAAWMTSHHDGVGVVDTPAAEASYQAAACYAVDHGLPTLPPLQFADGGSMIVACDVSGA